MARIWFSLGSTADVVKHAAIRFALASGFSGLTGAEITRRLTQSGDDRTGIVIAVSVVALVLPLLILLAWAFVTAPRRYLDYRVSQLEEAVETQQQNLLAVVGEKWGDPDQFHGTYHDLRSDLRDAFRKIERATKTGHLWNFVDRLDDDGWKRSKETLATHPWARAANVYGPCSEAFGHLDRLNTLSAVRWLRRPTRPGDDLEGAIAAILAADQTLSFALGELSPGEDQLPLDEELP